MIGKRGSGKSWAIRNIIYDMYQKNNSEEFVIISPVDKMNRFYGDFIDKVYYSYNSEIIEEVLAIQTNRISKGIYKNITVVLDDCLGSKGSWLKDQTIQEMLLNGRHYYITYILAMQYPLGITPEVRSNFDYIFLLAEDYISNLKRMYDHYAGMFPSFDLFKQSFSQLTSDYRAMTISNIGITRESLFDKVSYVKSNDSMRNNFKLKSLDINYVEQSNKPIHIDSETILFSDEESFIESPRHTVPIIPPLSPLIPFGNDDKINVIDKLLDCNNMMLHHIQSCNYSNKVNLINKMMDCNSSILSVL